ncbi:hypothetical protein [Pedococcus soli]
MSLTPYQPPRPTMPGTLSRRQSKDLTHAIEMATYRAQLDAMLLALKIDNAFKLRLMQAGLTDQLLDKIERVIAQGCSPMRAQFYYEILCGFVDDSNAILREAYRCQPW